MKMFVGLGGLNKIASVLLSFSSKQCDKTDSENMVNEKNSVF